MCCQSLFPIPYFTEEENLPKIIKNSKLCTVNNLNESSVSIYFTGICYFSAFSYN